MTPFLDLLQELPAAADGAHQGKEAQTSTELIDVLSAGGAVATAARVMLFIGGLRER
jgi:hypothetical protein